MLHSHAWLNGWYVTGRSEAVAEAWTSSQRFCNRNDNLPLSCRLSQDCIELIFLAWDYAAKDTRIISGSKNAEGGKNQWEAGLVWKSTESADEKKAKTELKATFTGTIGETIHIMWTEGGTKPE